MTEADSARTTSLGQPAPPRVQRPAWWLILPWIVLVCLLLGASMAHYRLTPGHTIADIFLFEQDMPVVTLGALGLLAWWLAPVGGPLAAAASRWTPRQAWRGMWIIAAGVAVVAVVGWATVYMRYPLSMDEFMARFDAGIIRTGQPVATVAPEWRPYVPSLSPIFRMKAPGNAFWVSLYLPVNAAFQAAFSYLGSPALSNALFSGFSVVAVFGIARRLWPDRLDAAVAAAVLLATSSQFLITAMSAYAMPAHLALNLAWLWLFLRGDRRGHAGAAVVAFAASGLHQVIFNPLFAAPFVLHLWLQRRWGAAMFHTAAYAVICLFWILYWSFLLRWIGAPPMAAEGMGGAYFLKRITDLIDEFDIGGFGIMAKNLLRFVTWQNPLAIALALLAPIAAWRAGSVTRSLLIGIVLTLLAMTALLPFQGHGWGYRYLHGLLGSVSLLAALVWIRLTDGRRKTPPAVLWGGLAICSALSLALLLPMRAYQVQRFIRPYASAYEAIRTTDADVVVIDPDGMLYAEDLARNDPFLTNRPKVMDLKKLRPGLPAELCAKGSIAVFDRKQGVAFGVRPARLVNGDDEPSMRPEFDRIPCAVKQVRMPVR